jgi:hypothetical protein
MEFLIIGGVIWLLSMFRGERKRPWQRREDWLNAAADILLDEYLMAFTSRRRPRVQVEVKDSLGTAGLLWWRHTVYGICYPRSGWNGVNRIVISAEAGLPGTALGFLVHELIHAIDNTKSGHGGEFERMATLAGLEGPMERTSVGVGLYPVLERITERLGWMPGKDE